MKAATKQRGFTLLELLIASAIFAASVVLVVGAFGISTRNAREIKSNRDLSESMREAIDEIAKEIEYSYNGSLVNPNGRVIRQDRKNVYNFAITNSIISANAVNDERWGRVLFVRDRNNHCRYYMRVEDQQGRGRLAYYIDRKKGCLGTSDNVNPSFRGPFYVTDEEIDLAVLNFRGVMNTSGKNLQAYVFIVTEAKTTDPDATLVQMRNRTVATIRNFGRE